MRIDIPQSSHPVTRLFIESPGGRLAEADFVKGHDKFDFEIPEGISIDEIGVRYEFLDNGARVVDGGVLKYASEKPADPIVPAVDIPSDESGCDCGDKEACSNCDPEDEIAELDDSEE
jgi:hypothetical protein